MSNGIGKNPLLDISRVYREQIAEKKDDSYLETDMKKRQANNEKARKDMEKVKGQKNPHFESVEVEEEKKPLPKNKMFRKMGNLGRDIVSKHTSDDDRQKKYDRQKKITKAFNANEGLDPVGQEDGDVNNDGKKDSSDKYLMKRRKAIGKAMGKRLKESRSLSEVMTDTEDEKPIKEKKINNKIKINPKLGEAVEEIGGTILEVEESPELDEALTGERRQAAAKKINTAKSGSDRATAFNLASRGDRESTYQKKSTGGKGGRFPGYGDRGAGNKAARRMGKEPMRQGPERRVTEAVYGGGQKKEAPKDTRMTVTAADKAGNTPAYQRYKAGDKRYKAADHMKESSFRKIQEKLNLKKTQWGT